jgi:hypothetical protein
MIECDANAIADLAARLKVDPDLVVSALTGVGLAVVPIDRVRTLRCTVFMHATMLDDYGAEWGRQELRDVLGREIADKLIEHQKLLVTERPGDANGLEPGGRLFVARFDVIVPQAIAETGKSPPACGGAPGASGPSTTP